ncbi:MAG TPA: S9 family peptidase, partial [Balneolaceae bacterium]|nr:S9 family peptidase [Balneolaceae bacterium]
GYNHVYLYDMEGQQLEQVTSGDWDVTELIGHNERTYELFYVSSEASPMERQLYSIRIDGKKKQKLTTGAGWHNINMSGDFKYYIDSWSDYNKPSEVSLFRDNGRKVRTIEDNAELSQTLQEYSYIEKEFMQMDVNGVSLNAYML